jgi:hypothetical protein
MPERIQRGYLEDLEVAREAEAAKSAPKPKAEKAPAKKAATKKATKE